MKNFNNCFLKSWKTKAKERHISSSIWSNMQTHSFGAQFLVSQSASISIRWLLAERNTQAHPAECRHLIVSPPSAVVDVICTVRACSSAVHVSPALMRTDHRLALEVLAWDWYRIIICILPSAFTSFG